MKLYKNIGAQILTQIPKKAPLYVMTDTPNEFQQYKGIWYKYDICNDIWILQDNKKGTSYKWVFKGDYYRIDQAFDIVEWDIKNNYKLSGY